MKLKRLFRQNVQSVIIGKLCYCKCGVEIVFGMFEFLKKLYWNRAVGPYKIEQPRYWSARLLKMSKVSVEKQLE